ncbi:hypothetical protein [Tepidibacillus marianensis]|uniref:hypothetical protein n=1 Tax=Tepidibacillus marianensis TaxID=3131995 RepID=UPI0030CB9580
MFRRTRIRLVSMFTLIFFVILCAFGFVLYLYMDHLVYADVNNKLLDSATKILQGDFQEIREEHDRSTERRIVYLFWDKNGQLLDIYPKNIPISSDLIQPKDVTIKGQLINNQTIASHTYRILTLNVHDKNILEYYTKIPVESIQLIINIDPETSVLRTLITLIIFGVGMGLIISFLVGLF